MKIDHRYHRMRHMRHRLVANWNPVLVLHDQHSCRSHLNTARRQLANADKILVHIMHTDSLLKGLQSWSVGPWHENKSIYPRFPQCKQGINEIH